MRPGGAPAGLAGALFALTVLLLAPTALAVPTFPPLEGRRVVDEAGILAPETETALTRRLEVLEKTSGRQLVVATLPSLQGLEIEDYGYRLGRAWGIGSAKADEGALLIVAPKERTVRIEVGYGLEPVLTDALASVIIQTAILPRFREGDLEGGVIAGTDAIVRQLDLPADQARTIVARAAKTASEPYREAWWLRPVLGFVISMLVTVVIPLLWTGFSNVLFGLGGFRRQREIRRPTRGLIDWHGGSFGGSSSSSGGFSGGGGSFGGGGASGSW